MTSAEAGLVLQHLRRLAGTRRVVQPPDAQLLERFTAQRDESAFTALVARHGPMVLNVCRSVLRHEQDAEDAFQATFLVLARKAASIRQPEAVAGWLYEVAHRVAVKAQADAVRRRAQERRATPMTPADPTLDMTLRDLRRVLHEELRRLPDKYRLPLVLCYLEGRSHEEAAGQLGWSKGTFRGRLDRGRERLRRRLAARGVALSALLCATAVAPTTAAEALVDSAVLSAVGGAASGALSARASALAEGVIRAMYTSKLKVATAVLLVVGLVAGAGALARQALAARQQPAGSQKTEVGSPKPESAAAKEAAKPAANDKDAIAYSGRVLGPDGKSVAGAKLYLTGATAYANRRSPSSEDATTGPDGRFAFTVPKAQFADRFTFVAATAAKHGIGWVMVSPNGKRDDLTLRLVEDDVPISGEIVGLEGKPIPGATLTVEVVSRATGEDLGPWLEAVKVSKGRKSESLQSCDFPLSPQVTTDAGGRFRIAAIGLGRDRLIRARLDGPGIASQYLQILTRPGKPVEVKEYEGWPVTTYYGATFRHVAAPSRPVVGVVRDKDTGKPLAGVTIESNQLANNPVPGNNMLRTTTDAQGRYRLTGLPKGEGNKIRLVPRDDQPYLSVHAVVPDSPGLGPVTVDFELRRGVWIEGKLTDKATGKPVQGYVDYFALDTNPNVRDHPGYDGTILPSWGTKTREDGSYRLVGLPGPGLVAVFYTGDHLLAPERDDAYGTKEPVLYTSPRQLGLLINYTALARIDPAKGVERVKRDVTLDPGWTFTGTVHGPDGKPLAGARGFGLHSRGWYHGALPTVEFRVRAFNPCGPRDVLFVHPEKGLVGVARPPKENGGPVTVRMEPGAAVTGRLVDADVRPRAGAELDVWFLPRQGRAFWDHYWPESIKTDPKGRFRIEALLPGYKYRLTDGKGDLFFGSAPLRSGQTEDLGDVQLKRAEE